MFQFWTFCCNNIDDTNIYFCLLRSEFVLSGFGILCFENINFILAGD